MVFFALDLIFNVLDGVQSSEGCHTGISPLARACVRVTRFSEYTDDSRPGKVLRLDFVLLDEQGTTTEAQIPERHISLFRATLDEDHVYYIECVMSSCQLSYHG